VKGTSLENKRQFQNYVFTLSSHQEEGVVSNLHSGICNEQTGHLYLKFCIKKHAQENKHMLHSGKTQMCEVI
jgi:hypothetical protein